MSRQRHLLIAIARTDAQQRALGTGDIGAILGREPRVPVEDQVKPELGRIRRSPGPAAGGIIVCQGLRETEA